MFAPQGAHPPSRPCHPQEGPSCSPLLSPGDNLSMCRPRARLRVHRGQDCVASSLPDAVTISGRSPTTQPGHHPKPRAGHLSCTNLFCNSRSAAVALAPAAPPDFRGGAASSCGGWFPVSDWVLGGLETQASPDCKELGQRPSLPAWSPKDLA